MFMTAFVLFLVQWSLRRDPGPTRGLNKLSIFILIFKKKKLLKNYSKNGINKRKSIQFLYPCILAMQEKLHFTRQYTYTKNISALWPIGYCVEQRGGGGLGG